MATRKEEFQHIIVGDPELQNLLQQTKAQLSLGRTKQGIPLVNVSFPSLEELAPESDSCKTCEIRPPTKVKTVEDPFQNRGFIVRFSNVRFFQGFGNGCLYETQEVPDFNITNPTNLYTPEIDRVMGCSDSQGLDEQSAVMGKTLKFVLDQTSTTRLQTVRSLKRILSTPPVVSEVNG